MTKMSAEERAKSIADAEPSGNETIRTMIHEEAWVQIRAAESIARAEGFKAGQERMRERAIISFSVRGFNIVASEIRALPIEEERK